MSAGHTPGPWTHEGQGEITGIEDNGFGKGPVYVCAVYLRTVPGRHDANTALIASAPDLLAERDRLKALNAELAAAIQSFIDYDTDDDAIGSMIAYDTALTKCRAALAKNNKGETA